jgi:hypothetical protein
MPLSLLLSIISALSTITTVHLQPLTFAGIFGIRVEFIVRRNFTLTPFFSNQNEEDVADEKLPKKTSP